jgi:ORF6N domain
MAKSKVARQSGTAPLPEEHITQVILVFRGHKVLLDEDLAALYGVQTGALVQAVKRNSSRFPADFMFQLTAAEWTMLRSRIVIPTSSRGGRRCAPVVAIGLLRLRRRSPTANAAREGRHPMLRRTRATRRSTTADVAS